MRYLTEQLQVLKTALKGYLDIFGEDFYLEIQRHETYDPEADRSAFPLQQKVIEAFKKLSVKYNVKLIASNDVHFINAKMLKLTTGLFASIQPKILMIRTGSDIRNRNILKSEEEMRAIFSDIPEAVDNVAGPGGKD